MATARTEAVEVRGLDAVLDQPLTGGAVLCNVSCRADVVGSHRITERSQHLQPMQIEDRRVRVGHIGEIRGLFDVSGMGVPIEQVAFSHRDGLPVRVTFQRFTILMGEELTFDARVHDLIHFFVRRPDVLQVHGLAIAARAERILNQISIDGARNRVRNHQRRRRQVVRADLRIDPSFKIAVAA